MPLALPASLARPLFRRIIMAGLRAADPAQAMARSVRLTGPYLWIGSRRYDLRRFDRVVAVGAGKASARMAQALERILGARLERGLVVVKYGHRVPTRRVTVLEAGHPVPDQAGIDAAHRMHEFLTGLGTNDLLIVLLSGGASSLMPAPVPGVTLRDKQAVTKLLLRSGATIQDVNIVRKHLSRLKGGRLAEATTARAATIILSDVIGDDLTAIGSGPTVPDPSTFRDAVAILKRRRIWGKTPASIRRHLLRGAQGMIPETPKPGHPCFQRGTHQIVGNNEQAVAAAAQAARVAGIRTIVCSDPVLGEAAEAGRTLALLGHRIMKNPRLGRRPFCIVAGGEPTVTVTGRGLGGRAQEFAVAAACEIAGLPKVWVAAVGTDGTDGPTEVAGAVVSGSTFEQAERKRLNLPRALALHDTYPVLKTLKSHLVTGPTGTNVNDLYLFLAL